MDHSKAFKCIFHDSLNAKMLAYGFSSKSLTFFYSYLKRYKQSIKINNTHSAFQVLLSGIPQGLILGPIVFNIFINNLFYKVKESELPNFAHDNTILLEKFSIEKMLKTLERESQIATVWFKENNMILNAHKFQSTIVKQTEAMCNQYTPQKSLLNY